MGFQALVCTFGSKASTFPKHLKNMLFIVFSTLFERVKLRSRVSVCDLRVAAIRPRFSAPTKKPPGEKKAVLRRGASGLGAA